MEYKDTVKVMRGLGFYADEPEKPYSGKRGWQAYFRDSERTWFTPITWLFFDEEKQVLEVQSAKITDIDWWGEEKDAPHYWVFWRLNHLARKVNRFLRLPSFLKIRVPIVYHPARRLWKFLKWIEAILTVESKREGLKGLKVYKQNEHPVLYVRTKDLKELPIIVKVFCQVYRVVNPSDVGGNGFPKREASHKEYLET